ncbi:MAG: Ribosome recycling factor, partial [uncultured Gemmatimonadetes bacterium]
VEPAESQAADGERPGGAAPRVRQRAHRQGQPGAAGQRAGRGVRLDGAAEPGGHGERPRAAHADGAALGQEPHQEDRVRHPRVGHGLQPVQRRQPDPRAGAGAHRGAAQGVREDAAQAGRGGPRLHPAGAQGRQRRRQGAPEEGGAVGRRHPPR